MTAIFILVRKYILIEKNVLLYKNSGGAAAKTGGA